MHQKSIVFLHIPKTAGVSVADFCYKNNIIVMGHDIRSNEYLSLAEYKKQYDESIFSFAFVRNPWDRLVSTFFYLLKGGMNDADEEDSKKYIKPYRDFDEFVCSGLSQ